MYLKNEHRLLVFWNCLNVSFYYLQIPTHVVNNIHG